MNLFEEAQKFMATRQKQIEPEQSFLSTNESKESFIRELKMIYENATNMEIVRYIRAMRSLIFNVDNTQVYNPTCQRVWFTCDEKTFVAEPGKVTCF